MMLDNANIFKARGFAIQGGAFAFFLLFFAFLSIRIGRFETALMFLPLMGIYLWPKNAAIALSTILIFGLGLAVDMLSGGPLGLWAFLYLLLFGVFRPDLRGRRKGLYASWLSCLMWIATVVVVLFMIGALFIPGRTDWVSLLGQGVVAGILFPLIYFLNSAYYKFFADPDSAEANA